MSRPRSAADRPRTTAALTRTTLTTAVAAVIVSAGVLTAPIAQADTRRTLSGIATCANSTVDGVDINSTSGSSGPADTEPVVQFGGLNSATYTFDQADAGRGDYWVSVRCGSGTTTYGPTVTVNRQAWACNDIQPWLTWTARLLKRVPDLYGRAVDTQVDYRRCNQI